MRISAERWPWQKGYSWGGMQYGSYAPLNQAGARFGGGWKYRLGIAVGGTTILIDLLFGTIRITFR